MGKLQFSGKPVSGKIWSFRILDNIGISWGLRIMLILTGIKYAKWHSIVLDYIDDIRQFCVISKVKTESQTQKRQCHCLQLISLCFLTHSEGSVIWIFIVFSYLDFQFFKVSELKLVLVVQTRRWTWVEIQEHVYKQKIIATNSGQNHVSY